MAELALFKFSSTVFTFIDVIADAPSTPPVFALMVLSKYIRVFNAPIGISLGDIKLMGGILNEIGGIFTSNAGRTFFLNSEQEVKNNKEKK